MDTVVLETKAQLLAEKCEQYSKEHGEENPDYLIEYGKVLFAIAKQSSSLVDAQKMDEKQMPLENPHVKIVDFEEQTEPEPEDSVLNAGAEKANEEEHTDESASKEAADKELSGQSGVATGGKAKRQSGEDGSDGAGDEEEDEEENGEEETDYAAAFEIVDVARVIYEKEAEKSKEDLIKLAKTRELLGDIALEDDNATQAVEDYTAAVELKRRVHGEDSGEVSEAEFMLSLAHDAAGDAKLSLEHLKLAAAAAEAAKLPSANDLKQKANDMQQDIEASAKLQGKDTAEAKETTKESISGRAAIATAIKSIVSDANDISQLTRKRKRPATEPPTGRDNGKPRADSNKPSS